MSRRHIPRRSGAGRRHPMVPFVRQRHGAMRLRKMSHPLAMDYIAWLKAERAKEAPHEDAANVSRTEAVSAL